jgi:hypothetical protein
MVKIRKVKDQLKDSGVESPISEVTKLVYMLTVIFHEFHGQDGLDDQLQGG